MELTQKAWRVSWKKNKFKDPEKIFVIPYGNKFIIPTSYNKKKINPMLWLYYFSKRCTQQYQEAECKGDVLSFVMEDFYNHVDVIINFSKGGWEAYDPKCQNIRNKASQRLNDRNYLKDTEKDSLKESVSIYNKKL